MSLLETPQSNRFGASKPALASDCGRPARMRGSLKPGKHNSLLRLIFPLFVFVGDFAGFVGDEEDHLAAASVGVAFGGQGGRIADFKSYIVLLFGLDRCDID